MNHLKSVLPIILSLLFFISCGRNNNQNEESSDTFDIQDYIKAAESKVYISSSILKQKMQEEEITRQEEGNIRKLLVIYLNQLDPSTGILYDAFKQQKDQLHGLVILNTFEKLKELAAHLQETKSVLAVAPISDLSVNKDLNTTFDLISNLRTVLITSSR